MEVCLVDNSNIINICYSTFVKLMRDKNGSDYVVKEEDLGMFWHLYVRKIKDYLCTYKNIIFCGEGHNSTKWRKEKYPLYKENRKDRADDPNYGYIRRCYEETDEFLKLFHCKTIRVDDCEADDVIYKLSEYFTKKGDQVKIISSDKDLTQICGFFDGVTVYNPMSSVNQRCVAITTFENMNKNIIMEKAIVGDASDNIKGLPGCGLKTFEKMLTDPLEWSKKMQKGDNAKLYETILSVVDLSRYPREFHDRIIDKFKSLDYYEFDIQGVEKFFFEKNLNQCLRDWTSWSGDILLALKQDNEAEMLSAEEEIMELLNS